MLHRVPLDQNDPTPFQILQSVKNRRRLARLRYGPMERLRFALFFYPSRMVRVLSYLSRGDASRAASVIRGLRER